MTNKTTSTPPPANQRQGQLLDVPIIHSLYQLYHDWHGLLLRFPKSQRYSLGNSCQVTILSVIEHTITAAGSAEADLKRSQLRQAATQLDLLRIQIRLAKDCSCISNQQYLDLQSQLHNIGRMLGGWLKSFG